MTEAVSEPQSADDDTPDEVSPLPADSVPQAEPPPPEAEVDALKQLEELDRAQGFGSGASDDDPLGMADPLNAAGALAPDVEPPLWLSPQPGTPPAPEPAQQTSARASKAETLEDLYVRHPEVGDGNKFIRVNRKSPKTWGGVKISGILADVHEHISLMAFAARFGGGVYAVSVMGPGRSLDQAGNYSPRTLEQITVDVPGKPLTLGPDEDEGNVRTFAMDDRGRSQVEIEKMRLEQEERKFNQQRNDRLLQGAINSRPMPENLFSHIEALSEKRASEVRESMLESIATLRSSNESLRQSNERKDEQIQELRQKLSEAQTEFATRLRDEETGRIRELKERQEGELRRVKDDHASTVQRMSEDHQRQIGEMTERHTRERRDYESAQQAERERLREDARRREEQLLSDAKIREQNIKDGYDNRIQDLERSNRREVEGIKEQRDRETTMIQTTSQSSLTLAQTASSLQVEALRNEVSRLQAELEMNKQENQSLRMRFDKSPIEAVQEAQTMLDSIGVNRGGAEEGELDWKRALVHMVKGIADKAPAVAEKLAESRQKNVNQREMVAARQRAAQAAQIARQRAAQTPALNAAPHQPVVMATQTVEAQERAYRPQQMPGATAPSWGEAAGPPGPGDAPLPPPPAAPGHEALPPQPVPIGSEGPKHEPAAVPGAGAEPSGDGMVPGFMSSEPPAPEAEAVVTPPPAPEPVAGSEAPMEPMPEIGEDAIMNFAEKLELAIGTGIVTPTEFAQGFIEEVGPEMSSRILMALDPDQLADGVAAHKGGETSQIVTHEGRKFLRELWSEAKRLLQEQAEAQ